LAFHPCVLAAPNNWEGTQMTELSESRTHVAMSLDQLRAVDHRPIVGCWPSLLVATSTASLQLDPAVGLSCEEAIHISGRLLAEIARWHEAIRRQASIAA